MGSICRGHVIGIMKLMARSRSSGTRLLLFVSSMCLAVRCDLCGLLDFAYAIFFVGFLNFGRGF